jgi:hypothetical protein
MERVTGTWKPYPQKRMRAVETTYTSCIEGTRGGMHPPTPNNSQLEIYESHIEILSLIERT